MYAPRQKKQEEDEHIMIEAVKEWAVNVLLQLNWWNCLVGECLTHV